MFNKCKSIITINNANCAREKLETSSYGLGPTWVLTNCSSFYSGKHHSESPGPRPQPGRAVVRHHSVDPRPDIRVAQASRRIRLGVMAGRRTGPGGGSQETGRPLPRQVIRVGQQGRPTTCRGSVDGTGSGGTGNNGRHRLHRNRELVRSGPAAPDRPRAGRVIA